MEGPARGCLAGLVSWKLGGGLISTILIFMLVYALLGHCCAYGPESFASSHRGRLFHPLPLRELATDERDDGGKELGRRHRFGDVTLIAAE